MATSPSDPPVVAATPPEVIALAIALAATMAELGADGPTGAPHTDRDQARWRWAAWGD